MQCFLLTTCRRARSHGYFFFLFFCKCYAIVCVYFCLGESVKLCVCLHVCFLVFKAFRINTDVLAAYTLYSFKYLTTRRTFHNHTVLLTEITITQFLHKEYNCRFFSKFLLDVLVVVVGSSCIHTGSFLSFSPSKIRQTVFTYLDIFRRLLKHFPLLRAAELSEKGARRALVLR